MMNEDKTWSIEHEGPLNKNNIVFKTGLVKNPKTKDEDIWVCNYCGSEEVYEEAFVPMNNVKLDWDRIIWPKNTAYTSDCCDSFDYPLRYSEWEEQIIEECNGNKDKYIAILDGSRA